MMLSQMKKPTRFVAVLGDVALTVLLVLTVPLAFVIATWPFVWAVRALIEAVGL